MAPEAFPLAPLAPNALARPQSPRSQQRKEEPREGARLGQSEMMDDFCRIEGRPPSCYKQAGQGAKTDTGQAHMGTQSIEIGWIIGAMR
jgi:hypothetical protein